MMPSERALKNAIKNIKAGGSGVLPTDTIYGLVGSALRKKTVSRIYKIRHRKPSKPLIILIADAGDIKKFGIRTTSDLENIFRTRWPGKISIILPCRSKKFYYLHRGSWSLAFRVPKLKWLREFLRETGPLVAPSANLQGMPAALTIREARKNFGKKVNFYVDVGTLAGKPSKIIRIYRGKVVVLRK
jgi:L-threonylcarbamoyladenylate synthase